MPVLADLFALEDLDQALEEGLVRVQDHPRLPLRIFNYTERAQYAQAWTPVTLACRGLIVDANGAIVARPLPKFFNYGQANPPALDLDAPVRVTDKADGSLGIIYPTPGGLAVATRGSFASDQAVHATEILRTRYATFQPPPGLTVLVEIIYPANRIVVDYGDMDDLMLLGAVEIATGRTFGPEAVPAWPGPVVATFAHATLADALAAPPRPNREGLVVWFPTADLRLKIKYDEYVRLHRIVTGLNARAVWERLAAAQDPFDGIPDEFHDWVAAVVTALTDGIEAHAAEVERAFAAIVADLPADFQRRDFAEIAARHPLRALLFLRLDGRDLRGQLWQKARPAADWVPRSGALEALGIS
jgi:putative RNA ligase